MIHKPWTPYDLLYIMTSFFSFVFFSINANSLNEKKKANYLGTFDHDHEVLWLLLALEMMRNGSDAPPSSLLDPKKVQLC
jgi:hypothetical protein